MYFLQLSLVLFLCFNDILCSDIVKYNSGFIFVSDSPNRNNDAYSEQLINSLLSVYKTVTNRTLLCQDILYSETLLIIKTEAL